MKNFLFLIVVMSLGVNAETKDLCLSWNPCDEDSSIRARLDKLYSPEPSCTVTFWLNSPGKREFTTADEVIISYKVSGKAVYLTLFKSMIKFLAFDIFDCCIINNLYYAYVISVSVSLCR
jgi:hypothetical protein